MKLFWTDDGSASKRRTKRPNAGSFAIVAPIDKRQYKPPVRWSLIRRGEVAYPDMPFKSGGLVPADDRSVPNSLPRRHDGDHHLSGSIRTTPIGRAKMDVRQAFLEASTEPSMSLDSGRGSVRYVLQAVGGVVHNRELSGSSHHTTRVATCRHNPLTCASSRSAMLRTCR